MPLQRDDLSRPVIIHICKDRTLSYRRPGTPIFNSVALPTFSVENEREAEDLLTLVGTNCRTSHPNPRYPHDIWMKLWNGVADYKPTLDFEDLDEASDYLREAYRKMKQALAA